MALFFNFFFYAHELQTISSVSFFRFCKLFLHFRILLHQPLHFFVVSVVNMWFFSLLSTLFSLSFSTFTSLFMSLFSSFTLAIFNARFLILSVDILIMVFWWMSSSSFNLATAKFLGVPLLYNTFSYLLFFLFKEIPFKIHSSYHLETFWTCPSVADFSHLKRLNRFVTSVCI